MSERLNAEGAICYFDDFSAPGEETNEHRFLSNFYVGDPIMLPLRWCDLGMGFTSDDPVWAHTGEHIFAAFKTRDRDDFFDIIFAEDNDGLPDPGLCKGLGRKCDLRGDWESVKYDVMAMVLRSKFTQDRPEGQLLLDTGDALLVEGTYWGDQVWGVALSMKQNGDRDPLTARGRNWLGTLLMARRAELRAEVKYGVTAQTLAGNARFIR